MHHLEQRGCKGTASWMVATDRRKKLATISPSAGPVGPKDPAQTTSQAKPAIRREVEHQRPGIQVTLQKMLLCQRETCPMRPQMFGGGGLARPPTPKPQTISVLRSPPQKQVGEPKGAARTDTAAGKEALPSARRPEPEEEAEERR